MMTVLQEGRRVFLLVWIRKRAQIHTYIALMGKVVDMKYYPENSEQLHKVTN